MNVRRACLPTALIGLWLATALPPMAANDPGASPLATAAPAAVEAAALGPATPAPERVLFIGNSHTSRHGGLDWLIANFVAAEGEERSFEGTSLTEGGVTLRYHWRNGAREQIRIGGYDTVVLQGYLSGAESRSSKTFLKHARLLDGVIRRSGATTVFFMTWPRGFNEWSDLDDAVEAHRTVAVELGARVAPAAIAFEMAAAERPELALVSEDQVHATWAGAYLAAATVYATLFGRSPEGLDYDFGVAPDDAAFLQRIAWQAVSEWQATVGGGGETLVPVAG